MEVRKPFNEWYLRKPNLEYYKLSDDHKPKELEVEILRTS
jgi:hypothetical protein